ncbi:Hypothetical protein PHPALM_36549 [Phytophthora palmivora]|uniref:Retrotransposon gag domain-containing protein n=1 Tax=Phytophthora palmivora TaxID=4796 RepID=A0A2P4WZN2_9STRA|nr:Hypothetical protein PHPALM_36549 [Phytophthora palmivora]
MKEIQQMKSETNLAVDNINTLKDSVNEIKPDTLVFDKEDLYPSWDVTGPTSDHTVEYEKAELERLIANCLKQKETPIYGGEDSEDIEVYALNMIMWYGAYGLHFGNPQVNVRVGQLVMNHTKGKAKQWILRDDKGPRTWTAMVKGMRSRFVTKAKEEELVASFFYCKQGTKSLDAYIEEFIRLGKTDNVSEHYKMILFKKGLKSTKLRELLQVGEFDSLEDLLDGARGLNPKDNETDTSKKPLKKQPATPTEAKPRGRGAPRCTANRCTPGDGVPGLQTANDHLVSWVFDPGKVSNAKYFSETSCLNADWSKYLGTAFFDEGADFCGVSEDFIARNGLQSYVVDRGKFQVTFGNGKGESIPNRTISLSIFVDEMTAFDYEFNVCSIPNNCDIMMGIEYTAPMNMSV